ncbi:MAG TPA: Hsp20/alpha crystallin family protein [Pyrinomonadaceae bacterium]
MAQAKRAEENKQQTQGTQQNPQTQGQQGLTTRGGGQQQGLSRQSQFASPFSFMRRFTEEMDRLFDDFALGGGTSLFRPSFGRGFLSPGFGRGFEQLSAWTPQTEVFQRGNELVVRADLPGLTRDQVNVELEENQIIIHGERRDERETNEQGLYQTERSYGSFYRSIPLPEGIDADQAKANFNNGVLEITMPMPERQSRGRRIEIGEGGVQGTQAKGRSAG